LYLVRELLGFPRHLSQHVGGFVISNGPLSELVPVENAAMDDRTVIQWEKNDLEDLGLLKVDVLGLGMLTAIRRSFELIRAYDGREYSLASVPAEDPEVYDMICDGDTMGVFQIESRAQMAMLPRLKPRSYYDLVIEVAIIVYRFMPAWRRSPLRISSTSAGTTRSSTATNVRHLVHACFLCG
jgi:error-prone DNA polymerase